MSIDTTKIDGYAEMSAEDKIKALEAWEPEKPDYSGYVKKEVFDKTASDLAKIKKKYKETQDAETLAKEAEAERMTDLQSKYDALLREHTLSKYQAEYVKLGYEPSLALTAATATLDADVNALFEAQRKHADAVAKAARKDALKNMDAPAKGDTGSSMTLEKLKQMNLPDRAAFKLEHPDEYRALYGK